MKGHATRTDGEAPESELRPVSGATAATGVAAPQSAVREPSPRSASGVRRIVPVLDEGAVARLVGRAEAYWAIYKVLRTRPDRAAVDHAHAILQRSAYWSARSEGAISRLTSALGHAALDQLREEWDVALCPGPVRRCIAPNETVREEAYSAVEVPLDGDCFTDIGVLALLAGWVAQHARTGQGDKALSLYARRRAFASSHAVWCAGSMATTLDPASTPMLADTMTALTFLLDDESRDQPDPAPASAR